MRSSILRACCASTSGMSMSRGSATALRTAFHRVTYNEITKNAVLNEITKNAVLLATALRTAFLVISL